jgi:hypothetical protein
MWYQIIDNVVRGRSTMESTHHTEELSEVMRVGDAWDGTTHTPVVPDTSNNDAWALAVTDWIDNGTMTDDTKWKRCVKSGSSQLMDDACWVSIKAEYI